MMQVCTCTVRLGGKIEQERTGKIATVAEIQVLKFVHGGDAVSAVVPVSTTSRSSSVEIERLRSEYTPKVVEAVFPGFAPTLPATLKDIGMDTPSQARALREKAERDIKMAELLEQSGDGGTIVTDKTPAPPTEAERFGEPDYGDDPEASKLAAKPKADPFGLGAAA